MEDDKSRAGTDAAEKRTRARALLERGYGHQLEGSLASAAECYRRAIELQPTAEAHTFLGCALATAGDIDAAIEQCRAAIRLDPGNGNAWQDMGAYHMEKGDALLGARYLRRALGMPRLERRPWSHANLGRVYLKQGLFMKALEEFRVALSLEPRDVNAKKAIREISRNFN